MGKLRSQVYLSDVTVDGVLLGVPVAPVRADGTPAQPGDLMTELFWAWDHYSFPNGVVNELGEVVVDEEEL